jgi:NUMOD3 motif
LKTENEYYIYFYLRDDGSPYYVGKGKGRRAWVKRQRVTKRPNDESKIIIKESNLSENDAFGLEWFYIQWYGRKDLGTGRLLNKTDGGEGVSGIKWTEESKNKLRGKPLSEETKKKMSEARKKYLNTPEGKAQHQKISLLGAQQNKIKNTKVKEYKLSEETRKKMSETAKRRHNTPEGKQHQLKMSRLGNAIQGYTVKRELN